MLRAMAETDMSKKTKRKWTVMRFRRHDPDHNLIAAACHWLRARGGRAVVIGGVKIIEWPGDLPYKFDVAIGVTGRKPTRKETKG